MSRTWFGLNSYMQQQALTMIFLDDMSSPTSLPHTAVFALKVLGSEASMAIFSHHMLEPEGWKNTWGTICCGQKVPQLTIFHGECITEASLNEWICLHFIRIFWMAKFLLRLSIMLPATCVVARAPYLNGKGNPEGPKGKLNTGQGPATKLPTHRVPALSNRRLGLSSLIYPTASKNAPNNCPGLRWFS